MKVKYVLATATALGALMSASALGADGDGNKTYIVQNGDDNVLTVEQDGSWNVAGKRVDYTEYLKQDGDNNLMTIHQVGNWNQIANTGPGSAGAHQTGDRNVLVVEQSSSPTRGTSAAPLENGNIIERVRQVSGDGTGPTNIATITQSIGDYSGVVGSAAVAAHYVGSVTQTHTGADPNNLEITQTGAYSSWYGGGQNNKINTVMQNGSGHDLTITQTGVGPVTVTSGSQQRGPANILLGAYQSGSDNFATVEQTGFQNYVYETRQNGIGNQLSIVLEGDFNGATPTLGGWHGHPTLGTFATGGGAAAVALAALTADPVGSYNPGKAGTAEQIGDGNEINYRVAATGSRNQFGFWQYGGNNKANNITVTGSENNLAVFQKGIGNELLLGVVTGSNNNVGLAQVGDYNTASLDIDGDFNGGGTLQGAAGLLAAATGSTLYPTLVSGQIVQHGNVNDVKLAIKGNDNQFAFLQQGNQNVISAKVTGAANSSAVVQIGNLNSATFTQDGSSNKVVAIQ